MPRIADEGVRLPGTRRQQAAARARMDGIDISEVLADELRQLARIGK
jgi:LDH2 family malate/lactate/ureidoglycolate dehydrogenase